ncbi:MAG: YbeD family protein [Burkholderiales bacterium]|jgi:putative lipoic acid-binding regulatory protein
MNETPSDSSLITYPCQFPIKVMGLNVDGFTEAMIRVALQFDPGLGPDAVQTRASSAQKYLAVTLTVTATSRDQLDELYRTLSTHPWVKMVL